MAKKALSQPAADAQWMRLALAQAALGSPSPNPHVGAVVVKGGKLVSKGFHRRAGAAHAEVVALERAGKKAKGATLYVTFEPCNHFGRTPPCTDAIIAAKVSRVVIGCRDVKPHVAGAIQKLRKAGIAITVGVCEAEAKALVADFEKHFVRGLPFVTLKGAMTLDGRIATRTGESKWISSPASRARAHTLRAANDAVLVGIGTVLADDPSLNVRHAKGPHPKRVVLDATLRTPPKARVLTEVGGPTYIFHAPGAALAKRRALAAKGAILVEVPARDGVLRIEKVAQELARRDVVRLLVEGGGEVHGAFLHARLVDRIALFMAPVLLGDRDAVPLIGGRGVARLGAAPGIVDMTMERIGPDTFITGRVRYR